MNFLLETMVLEVTEKHFFKDNQDQLYFQAQVYQPGVGVGTIGVPKDLATSGAIKPGKTNVFVVEFRNDKPRITGLANIAQ